MRQGLQGCDISQPYPLVVVYDATTKLGIFALTSHSVGELDSDTITVLGQTLPVYANIDELSLSDARPSFGAGMTRTTFKCDILNSGPLIQTPITKQFYSAGMNIDGMYVGLWLTDRRYSLEEVANKGMFYGYFKLDAGIGWEETALRTTFTFTSILLAQNGRYATRNAAAEDLLAGSEWQELLESPAYYGTKNKVKTVGRVAATITDFQEYNKGVTAVVAGLVQSTELNDDCIDLGKAPTLAQVVGTTVKLKFGNYCIVQGIIRALDDNAYGLDTTTGMTLNAKWDSIKVFNKGYTDVGELLSPTTTEVTSVFLDESVPLTRVPSPYMYLRSPSTVSFFDGATNQTSTGSVFLKLTGVVDEANKELSCEELKDPDNATWKTSGVNVEFFGTSQQSGWNGSSYAQFNYAKWIEPVEWDLYFTKDTFTLNSIMQEGMPWELIVTPHQNTGVTVAPIYYIKLIENTTITKTETGQYHLYANKGNSLVALSTSDIASIEYNCGAFGMEDLCKITLTSFPSAVNEAYDDNAIYVDVGPLVSANTLIKWVLIEAGLPTYMISDRVVTGTFGNPVSATITKQTWTELLDSVLFESGLQFTTPNGQYSLRANFNKANIYTWNKDTSTMLTVSTECTIPFEEVIDGTYKFDIGRSFTNIDAGGREFSRTHYTLQYVHSEYNGAQLRKLQTTKAPKDNDRIIDYTFKHIVDGVTATAAAIQMARMGHVSTTTDTTRNVSFALPLRYAYLQALDTITLSQFSYITDAATLSTYSDSDPTTPVYSIGAMGVVMEYTAVTPYALLPGVGVVDTITINFTSGPPVTVTFKQTQVATKSNIKAVAVAMALNTSDANDIAEATCAADAVLNAPTGSIQCPKTDNVSPISMNESLAAGTKQDPCCNVTSSNTTAYPSENDIVYVCGGDGTPLDDWTACMGYPALTWDVLNENYTDVLGEDTGKDFGLFGVWDMSLSPFPCPAFKRVLGAAPTSPYCVVVPPICYQVLTPTDCGRSSGDPIGVATFTQASFAIKDKFSATISIEYTSYRVCYFTPRFITLPGVGSIPLPPEIQQRVLIATPTARLEPVGDIQIS